jgi:hypothetical protein
VVFLIFLTTVLVGSRVSNGWHNGIVSLIDPRDSINRIISRIFAPHIETIIPKTFSPKK